MTGDTGMNLTAEQEAICDSYVRGVPRLVIQARAGTGKTTTLKALANAAPTRRILYMAFNKAVVLDAKAAMPRNVKCSTAHGLAFAAIGKDYEHRFASARMSSAQNARILGLRSFNVTSTHGETKVLQPTQLASMVTSATQRYAITADPAITIDHIGAVDTLDEATNARLAKFLFPYVLTAWDDLTRTDGRLRYFQGVYLKMWQLTHPRLRFDVIMFDEAQDADPLMADVVNRQYAQAVIVGDSHQSIYAFRGAVDALKMFSTEHEGTLSQSWRFGPAIAEVANRVLGMLPGDPGIPLKGNPGMDSRLDLLDTPDAILCRSNAQAISEVMKAQAAGTSVHLVGNSGKDVLRFAKAADELMGPDGATAHPELSCFSSWSEVVSYVEEDELGVELALMVKLVEDFGTEAIREALDEANLARAEDADLIVSTAHQAKGREWPTVRLASDFPTGLDKAGEPCDVDPEELRLLYVAVTRAREVLDISAVVLLYGAADDTDGTPPDDTGGSSPRRCALSTCGRPFTFAPGHIGGPDYCCGVHKSQDITDAAAAA